MDYSPPGSSARGILQEKKMEWAAIPLLHGIFPTQRLNPGLSHCRQIFYHLSRQADYHVLIVHDVFRMNFLKLCKIYICSAWKFLIPSLLILLSLLLLRVILRKPPAAGEQLLGCSKHRECCFRKQHWRGTWMRAVIHSARILKEVIPW